MKKVLMNNKVLLLLFLILIISQFQFVFGEDLGYNPNIDPSYANPSKGGETNFEVTAKTAAKAVTDLFSKTGLNPEGLSTILLGILLFMIIYSVFRDLDLLGEGKMREILSVLVSVIVTILIFMYMPGFFIPFLSGQFSSVGATILTILPFIIIFYFTMKMKSELLSKLVWLIFLMYYLFMFVWVWGNSTGGFLHGGWKTGFYFYLIGSVVCFGMFLFNKKFREWFFEAKLDSNVEKEERKQKVRKASRKLTEQEYDNWGPY